MIRARVALALLFAGACARPVPPAARAPSASGPVLAGWDSVTTTVVAPGVTHTAARAAEGPWAAQILTVDLARCRPLLHARKPGPPLAARATTSALGRHDLAAINADFFALPAGTPVGPHVEDGRLLVGPGRRIAFLVTEEGFEAGFGVVAGSARAGADSARIAQLNRPLDGDTHHAAPDALALYTGWYGDTVAASAARPALRLRTLEAGTAVVVSVDTVPVALASDRAALRAGPAAAAWLARRAPGDTIRWSAMLRTDAGGAVRQAVGAFPRIVANGRNVVAEQTGVIASFGPARHPRTAVGWSDDRLFLVVVDGRQPGWSDGMTLDELADLMLGLGARDALNLDGGGSTAMTIHGAVVNRPSDKEGERAVGNALALEGCEAAGRGR